MKSKQADFTCDVFISRDHWDVPLRVRLQEYLQFGRRLDDQLRQLVGRWSHRAAPGASNSDGRRRRAR